MGDTIRPVDGRSKSGLDAAPSEEEAGLITGTTGISSRVPPPSPTDSHQPVPGAPGCPAAGLSPLRPSPHHASPGDSGGSVTLGVAPSRFRRGSLVSELVPGTASRHSRVALRPSRFAWMDRHSRDVFPSARVTSLGARGSWTGGASARWPSPRPSWSRDPPDLHGHSTGRAEHLVNGRTLALVCFVFAQQVLGPSARSRERFASILSASSSFRPVARIAPRSRPCRFARMVTHPRSSSGPSVDVCFEIPKIAPPLYREPRSSRPAPMSPSSLRSRDAARLARRLRGFAPPGRLSFSTLPGYCTGLPVMGFVMFHRRDSDSPSRVPTLRSVAPRAQRTPSGLLLSMPGPCHPRRFPDQVHHEPCPLVLGRSRDRDLEAFLHSRSRDVRRRCRLRPSLASLGLPGV